jgi:cytochrome c-type biogenesis protein CcsB
MEVRALVADLSVYLFWAGLLTSVIAVFVYGAYALGAAIPSPQLAGQTEAGSLAIPTGDDAPREGLGRLATLFTVLTVLALAGSVAARWSAVGHAPMSNLYEFTITFAFAIAVTYLVFEVREGQRRFGFFALPLVTAMLVVATFFPDEILPLIPALQDDLLLTVHVSVIMTSYAVLTVSFVGAVVFLVQGGEGRQRFLALPSGSVAGDFAHRATIVGFPLLAAGIALGAWWANSAWGRYWGWDPKETSALVVLLSLAAYFHARSGTGSVAGAPGVRKIMPRKVIRSWRPDPMWWLVLAFGLMLFTYFGVNLWVTGLHSYAGV